VERARADLTHTNEQIERAHGIGRALGVSFEGQIVPLGLLHELRQLGEDLMRDSFTLAYADPQVALAMHTVIDGAAPASHKKQQAKDCLFVEHYLELARHVADVGVPMVFVSSNKQDYGGGSEQLHPTLLDQFEAVGLVWTLDLARALARIDRAA